MRYEPNGQYQSQSVQISEIVLKINLLNIAERDLGFLTFFKSNINITEEEILEKCHRSLQLIRNAIPRGFRGIAPSLELIVEHVRLDESGRKVSKLSKFLSRIRANMIASLEEIPSSKEKLIACLCARAEVDGDLSFWTLCLENGWREPQSLNPKQFRDLLEDYSNNVDSLHWLFVLRFAGLLSGRASEEKANEALEWYKSEFAAVGNLRDSEAHFGAEIALPDEGLWSIIGAVRSVKIRSAIFQHARRYHRGLLKSQNPAGYWNFGYGPDCKPNAMATASICVGIGGFLGFSEDELRGSITRACDWLVSQQRADGGWTHFDKKKSDVLVTALALDALRRCDCDHYNAEIERAENYLVQMQRADGLWNLPGRSRNALVALIAECLLGLSPKFSDISQFSDLSRDHYFFAVESSSSDEGVARQLSLIGLQMAAEFFTYHLLSGFEPPEPYFNDHGRTVGLREALALLEKRLVAEGVLSAGTILPYRTQLRELAIVRDEVVHKVRLPSKSELRRHIEVVHGFFNRMSPGFLS